MMNTPWRRCAARAAAAACAALLLASCTTPPTESSTDPRLDQVDPQVTDPELRSEPGVQFSIRPEGPSRQRLVVLFNGTGSEPASLGRLGRTLAAEGFHVIGLRYESALGTLDACPNSMVLLDPECHRRLRSETVFGAGVPPAPDAEGLDHLGASVTATTSVLNRLLAHVGYLAENREGQGWQQFLQRGPDGACESLREPYGRCDLRWGRVVAMGYSQGAGVALHLAQHVSLDRVAMLAGPFDAFGVLGSYVPAPWLSDPFATSAERIGVLIHPEDSHAGRQRAAVEAVGLTDFEIDVRTFGRPYLFSRRLVTTVEPDCPLPPADWAHSAPAGGGCTPEDAHADAWTYLAGGI